MVPKDLHKGSLYMKYPNPSVALLELKYRPHKEYTIKYTFMERAPL